ncbi:MAG: hypothetical protein AAGC95_15805 [Pseudomonadota bacterium]
MKKLKSMAQWSGAMLSAAAVVIASPAIADGYTMNGAQVAPEMQQLMAFYGFGPGAYYIDQYGNYGISGQSPSGNITGGPVNGWAGAEPTGIAGNTYAQAYAYGVTGVRIFWIYSPGLFSEATGGSSGYVHICPGNVYHATSEGATNVGGGYGDTGWGGVAGTSRTNGRWGIEEGPNGPVLAVYDNSGGAQRVPIVTMLQGRWKYGQFTYASEVAKASC